MLLRISNIFTCLIKIATNKSILNEFQSVPVQYILGFNKSTGFMDTNMYSYRIDKLNFKVLLKHRIYHFTIFRKLLISIFVLNNVYI